MSLRIFVLEENTARLRTFSNALVGHTVTCVSSARAAIALFRPPYDVVFLDHDLGLEEDVDSDRDDNGCAFVRACGEGLAKCGIVVVHTLNFCGADRMLALLPPTAIRSPYQGEEWIGRMLSLRLEAAP